MYQGHTNHLMVILSMFVRGTRKNVSTANMLSYTFLVMVDTMQLLNMSSGYKFPWLLWLLASQKPQQEDSRTGLWQ